MKKIQKYLIVKPSYIRLDKRGVFIEILNDKHWGNISYGKMKKGAVMGNHYHKKTDIFFFVTSGGVRIDIMDIKTAQPMSIKLSENNGVVIPSGLPHAIRFLKDSTFIMGKSKRYDPENPDTYSFEISDSRD